MSPHVNHVYRQWLVSIAPEGQYEITNADDDGVLQFYKVESGQYGQPVIIAEPARAVEVPKNIELFDMRGNPYEGRLEKIAGIVCSDAGVAAAPGAVPQLVHRFSMTNAKKKGLRWELNDDGELLIDGITFYLRALFQKDKNRIINYDAFFGREKPEFVRVIELEDLCRWI